MGQPAELQLFALTSWHWCASASESMGRLARSLLGWTRSKLRRWKYSTDAVASALVFRSRAAENQDRPCLSAHTPLIGGRTPTAPPVAA